MMQGYLGLLETFPMFKLNGNRGNNDAAAINVAVKKIK